jgi:hypothetical protein
MTIDPELAAQEDQDEDDEEFDADEEFAAYLEYKESMR